MNTPPESEPTPEPSERSARLFKAISKWDTDGEVSDGGLVHGFAETPQATDLPLTNAELVQLQIRVIALENLLAALLVDASDQQLSLAREIASGITPRPGFTPHRLTLHAAARMTNLIDRSDHIRKLQSVSVEGADPTLRAQASDKGRTV
jgi:hypothetical protein